MGSKDEVSRESTVRTGAEMAELAELDRGLAESLVERARREGLQLTGDGGLLTGLVKMVLESALQAEMAEHLGYEKGDQAGAGSGNARNGTSRKRVLTEVGPVELDIPRDRAGRFDPQIVPKHRRRDVETAPHLNNPDTGKSFRIAGNFIADGSAVFSAASVLLGSAAIATQACAPACEIASIPLLGASAVTGQASNVLAIGAAGSYAAGHDKSDAALNFSVGVFGMSLGGVGGRATGVIVRSPAREFLAKGAVGMLEDKSPEQSLATAAAAGPSATMNWLGFNWKPWQDQGSN